MSKKTTPKQKPRPSKEVLEMVKAAKEKTANKRKREDASQAAARIVREATEGQSSKGRMIP